MNISITFITSPPLEDMRGKGIDHRRAWQVSESTGGLLWVISSGYLWPWWEKLQVPPLTSPLFIQVPPQLSPLTPCYTSSSWLGKNGPEMDLLTVQLPALSCLVDIKWNWTSLALRQCTARSQVLFYLTLHDIQDCHRHEKSIRKYSAYVKHESYTRLILHFF